ncbi:unnamed protein product [Rotaria socialis]|uniref:Alpha-methylacyl-CoA racemase n=1 Tax=Rotaria socialis TaxID=392032 RepID=A0A818C7Y9_9BILA|nr:unnamed protein product [Rotaria socialis]CAF3439123.1 unnamed protein product [Rotaria socialis]CAF3540246.1 unnamed protein product [Rotaria socialis]CAF3734319.1 unnamed protein product [Rotaria socialis]CAF4151430.1 unnamed protein product [Rotaria socialis]
MALRGLKVLELSGLAPAPFCGMLLADYGASVIRVDRKGDQQNTRLDRLARGKRSISIDLKTPAAIDIFRRLSSKADVLIEPFRPGVMEKLGLGPHVLLNENKRLIYARLSGYGQDGPLSMKAGHDINYLSISGLLSMFGRANSKPHPPINLAADFAGGGLLAAYAIMSAIFERQATNLGQVLDLSLAEGSSYVSSWMWTSRDLPIVWFGEQRGENLLDGGTHFYDTYETSDGLYMAVGALEPQFYTQLLLGLGLDPDDEKHSQMNINEMKIKFEQLFKTKTQKEWTEIFNEYDACCTPVLDWNSACEHKHNQERNNFSTDQNKNRIVPMPAPKFSVSKLPSINRPLPLPGEHTMEILREIGYSNDNIKQLIKENIVQNVERSKSKL